MAERALNLEQLLALMEREPERMVVSPSARAASTVRQAFDRRQRDAGLRVWTPANVLSWQQWLSTLWTALLLDGADERLLLNSAQEHQVWREIITADKSTSVLTPVDALATLASSAWSLAAAYRALGRIGPLAGTQDARVFALWADEFERRCGHDGFLPPAGLEAALEEHALEGSIKASTQVLLSGFGELTPTQRSLLGSLEERNLRVESCALTVADAGSRHTALLPDERLEMIFAAAWLREFLAGNPGRNAALIVPDLSSERAGLEPVLREVLAPELGDIRADAASTPWEISAAPPLDSVAQVNALLDLAAWLQGALPLERISGLLLSPYFATGVSVEGRARFDVGVLQRQLLLRPELDLRAVLLLSHRDCVPAALGVWLNELYEVLLKMTSEPPRKTYADWTEFFRSLARTAGWPGEREQTAVEQAVSQAFDGVLDLLATLDFTGKRVTFDEALDALQRQTAETPAPSVAVDPALQVLTPEQAEGQVFDAVVFVRATDANLPAARRTNPLLDWGLQRSFGMPGGDPERDHAASVAGLERLLAGAGRMVFTSAEQSASGALRASRMIAGRRDFTELTPSVTLPAVDAIELDIVEDSAPLPALPSMEIGGGSRLLKLQAACGFLAFAELRLGGREPESHDAGFDAIESGNVLHRALEAFWNVTKTQQRLREMSDGERTAALELAIDGAISRNLSVASAWDRAYVDVQKQRMLTVLTRWMEFELQRGPFTVLQSERKELIEVGPLRLQVRMDRIDAVPDGRGGMGVVFVDYKTGASAKAKSWEGERPDEPQLPLYALAGDAAELQGLAFAKVRAGSGMEWSGLAAGEEVLPKKGSKVVDLQEYAAEWREVLRSLAEDFANGASHVEPKSYAVNCKRCSQRLLCRLDVTELMAQPDEEEEATGE